MKVDFWLTAPLIYFKMLLVGGSMALGSLLGWPHASITRVGHPCVPQQTRCWVRLSSQPLFSGFQGLCWSLPWGSPWMTRWPHWINMAFPLMCFFEKLLCISVCMCWIGKFLTFRQQPHWPHVPGLRLPFSATTCWGLCAPLSPLPAYSPLLTYRSDCYFLCRLQGLLTAPKIKACFLWLEAFQKQHLTFIWIQTYLELRASTCIY